MDQITFSKLTVEQFNLFVSCTFLLGFVTCIFLIKLDVWISKLYKLYRKLIRLFRLKKKKVLKNV